MIARFKKYVLHFKRPVRTSRGEYGHRAVWYLFLEENGITGVGECAPMAGLSSETPEQVEQLLKEICLRPETFIAQPEFTRRISSVHVALEMAWQDLRSGGLQLLFPSPFAEGMEGIPVNGLIWMGDADFMQQQADEKPATGFRCIKLKIGGIDFERELKILKSIRRKYEAGQVMLRIDANGAFRPEEALEKLHRLAPLQIHSIEQPVAAGQWQEMARICRESPIPVALDEELININTVGEKAMLLDTIRPQYLVLKPSLHGGFSNCSEWIGLAQSHSVGWWVTSYLESNVGLNAIAQWACSKEITGFQGLGTGSLFANNIDSPLEMRGDELWINPEKTFVFPKYFF
jgi:o-succinylbenzoate synthase